MMQYVDPMLIRKMVEDVEYPASKKDIIEAVEEHGVNESVIEVIQRIRQDRFDTPDDVSEAVEEVEVME